MESVYAYYPGLVIVTPATVADAYSMMIDAVALDDPVLYCEHKFLYRWLKADELKQGEEHLPIGQARIVRPGKHATVVTYSAMVHEALRASEGLRDRGSPASRVHAWECPAGLWRGLLETDHRCWFHLRS